MPSNQINVKPIVEVASNYEGYDYKKLDLENSEDKAIFEGGTWKLRARSGRMERISSKGRKLVKTLRLLMGGCSMKKLMPLLKDLPPPRSKCWQSQYDSHAFLHQFIVKSSNGTPDPRMDSGYPAQQM
ncbi:hypothetical protein F5141DRAFT_1061828 [Pisolithus sp. B1]|nr:hypothetical protein F5141DRAFT_1061828 [Pisolithus sp. B1]